jgi:hypothetical protein
MPFRKLFQEKIHLCLATPTNGIVFSPILNERANIPDIYSLQLSEIPLFPTWSLWRRLKVQMIFVCIKAMPN